MVEWTPAELKAIQQIWGSLKVDVDGPLALQRCLIVYPWTQRYFKSFGNLSDSQAIMSNPKVSKHGVTVLKGLETALQNMNNMKKAFSALSTLHSETLNVDPSNFKLLGDCLTVVVAARLGDAFTAEAHAVWQKFLCVVIAALGKQYF